MGSNWYCAWDKKKHGPFSKGQLIDFWVSGKLRPYDYVLQEGAQKWIQANDVPGLADERNFRRDLAVVYRGTNKTSDPTELAKRFDHWRGIKGERSSRFFDDLLRVYQQRPDTRIDHAHLAGQLDQWRATNQAEMQKHLSNLAEDDPLNCPISLFGTMDYGRLETAHTRTLRWLLDPLEGHGFGSTLLTCLLRHLHPEYQDAELIVKCVESEHKIQKVGTNALGRLDVIAKGHWKDAGGTNGNWVLMIEAKVDAGEGFNQLDDYDEWLSAHAPNEQIHRVFLTPDGRRAMTGSDKWMCLSFLTLACVFRQAFETLKNTAGFHFLRFYVTGILREVCGWKLPIPEPLECADPYSYVEYLRISDITPMGAKA